MLPGVPPTVSQPEFLEVIPHPDARRRGRTFPFGSATSSNPSPSLAQHAAQKLKRKALDTLKRGASAVSVKQSRAESADMEIQLARPCPLPLPLSLIRPDGAVAADEDEFYRRLSTEVVPQLVAHRFEALTPTLVSRNSAFASYSVMAAMVVTRGLDLSSAELVCLTTGAQPVYSYCASI